MFDVFTDIFACRENALTRLDPRVKMLFASLVIATGLVSQKPYFPLAIAATVFGTAVALRVPFKLVITRTFAPLGVIAALAVSQTLMTGTTVMFTYHAWGLNIVGYQEGFTRGVLLGARVLGCMSAVFLLSLVTPAHKIFHALRWFKVPDGWIETALLVYRYTFTLLDRTSDVAMAQRARLGYVGWKRSLESVGILAGAVITQSLDQAVRTHEAMSLRGYNGKPVFGPMPAIPEAQLHMAGAAAVIVIAVYLVLEWVV